MNIDKYKENAPTILRFFLGLMFIFAGIDKLLNPAGIIGMLGDIGFPSTINVFFGFVLLSTEITFGFFLIIGFNVKLTVLPLILILLVALITVHIPELSSSPMARILFLFHFVGIAGLISIYLTGPGPYSWTFD
jgi:putative oxidoreductase